MQQTLGQSQESPFTTSLDSATSRANPTKFFPYASNLTGSQTQREMNSSLLAPTVSSLQRATLSSSIGPIRSAPLVAPPTPHTARTPDDINATLRSLHMPVHRPTGPVHRHRVRTASLEPELAEEWLDDGQSFVYLADSNEDALRDESINEVSRYSTFKQYQSDTVPHVVLPTTPAERPYSTYSKITRQLARKKQSEDRNYPGACVRPFLHPEEVQRKEYMQSKQKFLSGQFKTSFGPGKTSLEIRKEGFLRAEGPFPLDPPEPVSARPDNTTAIHFVTLQRSRQPKLAGDWKW